MPSFANLMEDETLSSLYLVMTDPAFPTAKMVRDSNWLLLVKKMCHASPWAPDSRKKAEAFLEAGGNFAREKVRAVSRASEAKYVLVADTTSVRKDMKRTSASHSTVSTKGRCSPYPCH